MKIEGKNQVIEAIKNDVTINKIYIDKNFMTRKDDVISLAKKSKLRIEFLPKKVMDTLSATMHHQGYIAETVEFQYCELQEILDHASSKERDAFVVLLDGIEDPHNMGAIIRTCECAGVDGIVIPKVRACQVNETVVRTSAGAISNMKIARVTNLKEAIDFFKENGLWIYVAEANGQIVYKQDMKGPIGIVIGSEGNGVKQSIISYCDGVISLPLKGNINSLNASVATAVVVYEVVRQRESK